MHTYAAEQKEEILKVVDKMISDEQDLLKDHDSQFLNHAEGESELNLIVRMQCQAVINALVKLHTNITDLK